MKNFLLSLLLLGSVQARSTYLSGKDTRDTDESNGVSHLYTTTRDSVVEGRASDPISAQDDEDDIEFDRLFPDEANPPDFDNLDPTYPYSETDTWPADFDTWNDTTPADVSANFDPKVFAEEDPASLAAANRHPWYKVKVLTEFLLGIDQVSFEAVSAKDHLICGKVKNKILVPITSKWTFKCKKGKDHGWGFPTDGRRCTENLVGRVIFRNGHVLMGRGGARKGLIT
ncbi:Nn.00g060910.m01.CDS01 [Neocucurbitaria sp. VM-36]